MIRGGASDQIARMVEKHSFLESFTHILTKPGKDLKQEALEAVQKVLATDREYASLIKKAGLHEIIHDLAKIGDFKTDLILEYLSVLYGKIENPEENGKNQGDSDQEDSKK